jgi:hypothetical protein
MKPSTYLGGPSPSSGEVAISPSLRTWSAVCDGGRGGQAPAAETATASPLALSHLQFFVKGHFASHPSRWAEERKDFGARAGAIRMCAVASVFPDPTGCCNRLLQPTTQFGCGGHNAARPLVAGPFSPNCWIGCVINCLGPPTVLDSNARAHESRPLRAQRISQDPA